MYKITHDSTRKTMFIEDGLKWYSVSFAFYFDCRQPAISKTLMHQVVRHNCILKHNDCRLLVDKLGNSNGG